MLWSSVGLTALSATTLVLNEIDNPKNTAGRVYLVGYTALGAFCIVASRFEYPMERLVRLWSEDPGLRQVPRLTVSPIHGGAALGLAGSF